MSNIAQIFPTLIYKRNVTEDYDRQAVVDRVRYYLDKYVEYPGGNLEAGARGFHDSFGTMHKDPVFKKLVGIINSAIGEYWEALDYSKSIHPGISQFWANQYPAGGWASMHNHSPMWMTGVFYLNCQPSKGNIYFQNPNQDLIDMQPISDDQRYNKHVRYHEFELQTNDLVIFPGWAYHETVPYTGDDIRVVLPFEVNFRGYDVYKKFAGKL